ncbi:MAG TPA: SDR family oxidoreductase [Pseudonocardia sp.]|jgi:NAD(P)-dependent dehydrogenase (short-subunit alcohol dehydrogenase family)
MTGVAVLGGSGGLGVAVVERLARRTPVTVGYLNNAGAAAELVDRIRSGGGSASAAHVDMGDGDSVTDFLAEARSAWGGLEAVVSATGPAIPLCPLDEVTDEDFARIYRTDVLGSFNVIRHAGRTLARDGGGSIVVFLTAAVLRTLENDGMSGAPKTAVAALMRQAARELGPTNVRINGVAPGVIDAGIVHSSFEVTPVAKGVIESCLAQTPMGRMGRPDEVAAAVDFLASGDSSYISGQVIGVDGGYSA